MTAPDFSDWTQPVGFREQDVLLGTLICPASNQIVGPFFDVSQMSAVALDVFGNAGGSGNVFLRLEWFEGAFLIDTEMISCWGPDDYASFNGDCLYLHIPVKAASLRVTMYSTIPQIMRTIVRASTRQLLERSVRSIDEREGRLLSVSGAVAVNPGSSASLGVFGPVSKGVTLTLGTANSLITYTVGVVTHYNGVATSQNIAQLAGATAAQFLYNLLVPDMAIQVTARNTDTVARSASCVAWDVS